MAVPPFLIQLVDKDGRIVVTQAGGKHEADLVQLFVDNIMSRKVGLFRSSAQVEKAIREGIEAAILSLKVKNPLDVVSE